MSKNHFDYIVIGGGSSGSVVASRLSENPNATVCLIEAGKSKDSLLSKMPLSNIFQVPELPGFNNWKLKTVPQKHLNNRTGYQPRGKTLGGSSAINGMIYMRGHPDDYNQWNHNGCNGWGWKDVLPYFLKSENNNSKHRPYHNSSGELHVADSITSHGADAVFLNAAQSLGYSRNDDFNGNDNLGYGRFQLTQFHDHERLGTRCSTAATFISPNLNRANLTVLSNTTVNKLVIEDGKATSIIVERNRKQTTLSARYEIVLSAGTFGSPAILLRSGIGSAEELTAIGIRPVLNKQAVGRNLQDHLQCALHYSANDRRFMGLTPSGILDLVKATMRWRKDGTGLGATSFTESGVFLKSDPKLEKADLQIHFFGGIVDDHGRKLHFKRGFSAHVCVLHPKSKGHVRLQSHNPKSPPIIDPNYLSSNQDETRMIQGVKALYKILEASPFKKVNAKALQSINMNNDNDILNYIKDTADTAYHPVGTCRMGEDEHAVVDSKLKFHGIDGLRIADASIMPSIISGNTNAACIMIGERAADFIKYEQ